MACPYCFEFEKPNYKFDNKLISDIESYVKDIIHHVTHKEKKN
jgi:hypothetical protein